MHVRVGVGTALGIWCTAFTMKMESENAGKPVKTNLNVLTVAQNCRLFATERVFLYVWTATVSSEGGQDFYTCCKRKGAFEIFGISLLNLHSRERHKIQLFSVRKNPHSAPFVMAVQQLASLGDWSNCTTTQKWLYILHKFLAPVHWYDETSTCRQ